MSVTRGAFVFRDDGDGCITGKYCNTDSEPFIEAAKRVSVADAFNPFSGVYNTVWLEVVAGTRSHHRATLAIQPNITRVGTFDLEWRGDDNGIIFQGIGMLYNGLLVGGYWSTD